MATLLNKRTRVGSQRLGEGGREGGARKKRLRETGKGKMEKGKEDIRSGKGKGRIGKGKSMRKYVNCKCLVGKMVDKKGHI